VRQLEFRDGIPHDDVDALARAAISGQAALHRSQALVRIVQETNVVAGHDRPPAGSSIRWRVWPGTSLTPSQPLSAQPGC
jgi:hypothetical protein